MTDNNKVNTIELIRTSQLTQLRKVCKNTHFPHPSFAFFINIHQTQLRKLIFFFTFRT